MTKGWMNKIKKIMGMAGMLAWMTAAAVCPAYGEAKAEASSLDLSDYLRYEAEGLKWDGEEITLTGSFVNVSSGYDVYDLTDVSLAVYDGSGVQVLGTTLNSLSADDVYLAPGERWTYVVVRDVPGFDSGRYNLSAYSVQVACEISVSSHKAGCSGCASKTDRTFSTRDTMSQEEMLERLRKLTSGNSGSGQQSSTSSYIPELYTPVPSSQSGRRSCSACGGTGKVSCDHCGGDGNIETQYKVFCGVMHHEGCNGNCGGKCHKGNCYGEISVMCRTCNGSGQKRCSVCSGTGTVNY